MANQLLQKLKVKEVPFKPCKKFIFTKYLQWKKLYRDNQSANNVAEPTSFTDKLSEDVKGDYVKLKKELLTAFSINIYSAYSQLRERALQDNETVDVYLADLRKLVESMGQTNLEPLLKCAFMSGLPSEIACQLKATAAVEEMELREIVTRARAILSSNSGRRTKSFSTKPICGYNRNNIGYISRNWTAKEQQGNENGEPQHRMLFPTTNTRNDAANYIYGIYKLKGVTIRARDRVTFGCASQPVVAMLYEYNSELKKPETDCLTIEDTDFKAVFDGTNCEIEQWISNGWLEPHDVKIHGDVSGIIPLMAVFQPNKGRKVRPVMDYSRELNKHVNSNPGNDVAICQEKLRQWRTLGNNVCMLDLTKAYLQLHVDSSLQRFQAVRFNGQLYVMTRLGLGLNVAPKIMSRILAKVLSMDEKIAKGKDHYIDDIVVNEDVVSALKVKDHLQKYGLLSKKPESLSSARVLGLRVKASNSGTLKWSRDSELPEVHSTVPGNVKKKLDEIDNSIHRHDPVTGQWKVPASESGKMWCDASSLAIGACVEIDNQIVEDASWLRGVNDGAHINMAELEGVIKAINMAMKWNLKNVTILTDSATVFGWVKSVLQDCKRPKVSGLSEMLVKRRLNLLNDLISEYQLVLQITLVKSEDNKADELTRAPRRWLEKRVCAVNLTTSDSIEGKLRNLHEAHHLGVDRTWYLAIERLFKPLLDKWGVNHIYSCAYRASGNGMIECNHRTIKRMLARSGGTVNDMLYWYNNSPNANGVVPFRRLCNYNPQKQETTRISAKWDINLNPYKVGDQVYVKPGNAKCTSVWKTGKVTSLVSNTAVKVDDMTRHIGDLRFCWRVDKQPATLNCELDIANTNTNESTEGLINVETPPVTKDSHNNYSTAANNATRPARARKPPDF
ncbi:uncharacterized protein [Watersipora subatra]|uniref:uncharacterized protein n=1 Tax=Watersipora subatra TaxID=2589382 RepID=UPI00355BB06C